MKSRLIATVQEITDNGVDFFPHVKRNENPEKSYSFYFAATSLMYLYNIFEAILPLDEREDYSDNFKELFDRLFKMRMESNKRFYSAKKEEDSEHEELD